jgi:hypothetical protein
MGPTPDDRQCFAPRVRQYAAKAAPELTSVTKEDPREGLAPQDLILEPELVFGIVVLDQPDQDTSTLEDVVSFASSGVFNIIINKCRDPSIGVDLQEFRRLLLLLVELNIDKVVSELGVVGVCFPQFFEESVDFETVGCTFSKKVEFGFTIVGEFGMGLGEFGGLSVWHFGY